MADDALVTIDSGILTTASDDVFKSLSKSGDWLGRLQLMTAGTKSVKAGKFPMNHYALVEGQDEKDLGEEVDALVLSWRPKAIEMGEEIITVYDPKQPDFARISELSAVKDSGCMFGVEFLVWVPAVSAFATLFMGSKSSRREAPAVKARMLKAVTLKSVTIETKKYTWQTMKSTPCSTPFALPDQTEMLEEVKKFNNPKVRTTEPAPEEAKEATERAR